MYFSDYLETDRRLRKQNILTIEANKGRQTREFQGKRQSPG